MGRRTTRPVIDPASRGLPEPVLAPAALEGPLDFVALFGRRASVELEIGFGKARFLVAEACARPAVDFLGIEHAQPYVRLARERVLAAGLSSVRLLHGEAADLLRRRIPAASIQAVHVLFPDPWPKRRHNRRRFLCTENLRLIAAALVPGGTLNIATDHAAYAAAIPPAAAAVQELIAADEFQLGELGERSNYAAKMRRRGGTLFARTWTRA